MFLIRVVIKCSLKYKTIGWIRLFFNFIIVKDNMTNVIINLFTSIVLKLVYLVLDIQYTVQYAQPFCWSGTNEQVFVTQHLPTPLIHVRLLCSAQQEVSSAFQNVAREAARIADT